MTGDAMSAVLGAAATYVDAAADGAARALTVVVGSVAGRRFFRREVLPLWKERWADLSVTYSVADGADAPPPPPLQREWPSAAAAPSPRRPPRPSPRSSRRPPPTPPPPSSSSSPASRARAPPTPPTPCRRDARPRALAHDGRRPARVDRRRWRVRHWTRLRRAAAALDGGGAAADGLPARLLVSYEGHSPLVSALAAVHRAAAALPLRVGAAVCVVERSAAEARALCGGDPRSSSLRASVRRSCCRAPTPRRPPPSPPSRRSSAPPTPPLTSSAPPARRAPPPRSSRCSSSLGSGEPLAFDAEAQRRARAAAAPGWRTAAAPPPDGARGAQASSSPRRRRSPSPSCCKR